jgi:hypothetical protein
MYGRKSKITAVSLALQERICKINGDNIHVEMQASRTGAAVGRGMERAGESVGGKTGAGMKDEGRGFQAKQQ